MPLTDPVPSSSFDVLERNVQDTDKFVNQATGTFTNRVGKVIKPIPVIEAEANAAVISIGWNPVGEFLTGFTYEKLNDVGRDASGSWWRYNGSDLPKAITAGTVPSSPNFSVISFETADNVQWKVGKSVGYSLDDLQGFTEELYAQAGIVDSGLPDVLGNSQRVEAIKLLDYTSAKLKPSIISSAVARTLGAVASDNIRLDVGLGLTPNDQTVDNGPILNVILLAAATARAKLDGFGAKFYVRTPVIFNNYQHLVRCKIVSMGSPDGASVPKAHIPTVHINGTSSAKTGMYFEDVDVDGSRQLWPNISMSTVGLEGGGGEDGGMHAWRIAGEVTDSTWIRCSGVNSGTAGWAIHNPTPSTVSVEYKKRNLTFIDCNGTGNREHGMFADSFDGIKWIRGNLTGNGLDLNTTDPLTHGNRGARDTNNHLFGMPFDLEAYGPNFLGSQFKNFTMRDTDCRYNAIMPTVYSPIANNVSGFEPITNINIIDSQTDMGLAAGADRDPAINGLALNIVGNRAAPSPDPISGVNVSCAMSGRPRYNGVGGLSNSSGRITSTTVKADVYNCNNYDISCSSNSSNIDVSPVINASFVKGGGSVGTVLTPTLNAVRPLVGSVISLEYTVSLTGALIADGAVSFTISAPTGYVIAAIISDAIQDITTGLAAVSAVAMVYGSGQAAWIINPTNNNLAGTISIAIIQQ